MPTPPLSRYEKELAAFMRERFAGERSPLATLLAEAGLRIKDGVSTSQFIDAWIADYLAARREVTSSAIREGIAGKKARSRRHCHYPGYGFRWTRNGCRVPDESQRQAMARILAWREQGKSWYAVAAGLLRAGFRLPDGREWSIARCRRVVALAAELRAAGELPAVTDTAI